MVVSELVEHLDLQDMIVMGQDWGGPIATGVALNAPERVSGVVFGNTWCWPADFRTKIFSRIMSTWPVQWLIKHRNLFVRRIMPMMLKRSLTAEELDHYLMAQPTSESRLGVAEFLLAHPMVAHAGEFGADDLQGFGHRAVFGRHPAHEQGGVIHRR